MTPVTSVNDLNVIDLPRETWRPIPGYLNYYASSAGRIATTARRATSGGLLKLNTSQPRRPRVSVAPQPGWPQTRERVSRLVCLAFHGPRPSPRHHARHRDGDGLHNAADNVHWKVA